jgi:hypothetical protein
MSTFERWARGRPTLDALPGINGGYTDNPVADWLTAPADAVLMATKAKVDDMGRQLSPADCDPEWLDFMAPLLGFDGEFWDRGWPEAAKRSLLQNSQFIWEQHGTREVLRLILNAFQIRHLIVEAGAFIIGVGRVGDPIGFNPWAYEIYLPTEYQYTPVVRLTERLNSLHGPCWCSSEILFDDDYFPTYEALLDFDEAILIEEENTFLEP